MAGEICMWDELKSESVEFADWIKEQIEKDRLRPAYGGWIFKYDHFMNLSKKVTIEQLYTGPFQEFKSKTND
jgi:hypothetical protein